MVKSESVRQKNTEKATLEAEKTDAQRAEPLTDAGACVTLAVLVLRFFVLSPQIFIFVLKVEFFS